MTTPSQRVRPLSRAVPKRAFSWPLSGHGRWLRRAEKRSPGRLGVGVALTRGPAGPVICRPVADGPKAHRRVLSRAFSTAASWLLFALARTRLASGDVGEQILQFALVLLDRAHALFAAADVAFGLRQQGLALRAQRGELRCAAAGDRVAGRPVPRRPRQSARRVPERHPAGGAGRPGAPPARPRHSAGSATGAPARPDPAGSAAVSGDRRCRRGRPGRGCAPAPGAARRCVPAPVPAGHAAHPGCAAGRRTGVRFRSGGCSPAPPAGRPRPGGCAGCRARPGAGAGVPSAWPKLVAEPFQARFGLRGVVGRCRRRAGQQRQHAQADGRKEFGKRGHDARAGQGV